MTIDTKHYRNTHGARPRGWGQWLFCTAEDFKRPNYHDFLLNPPLGTYYEAVKWIKQKYTGSNETFIVCP